MPARIEQACEATGQRIPASRPELVRCILDSLAVAYLRAVRDATTLSGHDVDVIHLVGGGVRNSALCQLTADACGLPVLAAGLAEATAIGNTLVQARTHGLISGSLEGLRRVVRTTQAIRRYEPRTPPVVRGP